MKLRVFIASPYTLGDTAVNVKKSFMMFHLLMDMGLVPFAPLTSHFLHLENPRHYNEWTDWDNEWLDECDIMIRMPGESSGADNEVKRMTDRFRPIFYNIKDLYMWVNEQKDFQINPAVSLDDATLRYEKIISLHL